MPPHPSLLAVLFLPALLLAQRPTPTFEHMKRSATIEFGAVPVGKHSIAELPVGETWRLGMNEASQIRLDLPLLAGDSIVAPGHYRVNLQRTGDTTCALMVNGSGLAMAATGDGRIDGNLGKAQKPVKKLDIQWRKKGAAVAGNQGAQIVVQFGPDEWVGDATAIGHKPITLPGWKAVLFLIPTARLEAGLPTPVATLSRGDENWNLVVAKDDVKLIPWMAAPTEQFGFGDVKGPEPARIASGTRTALEIKVEAPRETLDLVSAKKEKGELRLEVAFGKEGAILTVPEPKPKGGK